VSRAKVLEFFSTLPACVVGIEACQVPIIGVVSSGRSAIRCG